MRGTRARRAHRRDGTRRSSALFTSGYPAGTLDGADLSSPTFHFIQKPYMGNELVSAVRSILDNPKA